MKKFLSVILCVVIALLPMCICVSAVGKANAVSALKGLTIDSVKNEDDKAIIFAKDNNARELIVFTTLDGKNFSKTVINFENYVGKCGSNDYISFNYDYSNMTFVAFVCKKSFSDFDYKEKTILLVSTDFKNFKQYDAPSLGEADCFDVLVTKNNCMIYCGNEGYVTKDFKNFTEFNAPLENYKAVGNGIIAFDKRADGFCDGYDPVYLYSKMYYTEDMKNYTKIWESANSEQTDCPIVVSVEKNTKELYIFDFQNRGNKDGKLVINAVNKTSGKSRQIFSVDFTYPSDTRDYFNAFTDGDNYFDVYLLNKDKSKELYTINLNTEKIEKGTCDYSITETLLFKDLGNQGLILDEKNVYIIDYSKPQFAQTTDITKCNFINNNDTRYYCFKIKNSAFLISNTYSETKILELPINTAQNKTGDLNGDNSINSSDALMILQYAVGSIKLDETAKTVADVTKDGNVNSADALKVLQYSVGQITAL